MKIRNQAKHNFVKIPGLILIAAAAFLLSGEILLRLFYFGADALIHPRRYEPIVTVSPWHLVLAEHPRMGVVPRANYEWFYLGHRVRTNRHGLVETRDSLPEHENQKVIVMMGESYMEGAGVDLNERVSALLEEKIRSNGEDYAVLNMALTNTVLESQIERLKKDVLAHYKPDIVLVAFLAGENLTGNVQPQDLWSQRIEEGGHVYPFWKVSFMLFVLQDYFKNLTWDWVLNKLRFDTSVTPLPASDDAVSDPVYRRLKDLMLELTTLGEQQGFRVVLVPVSAMKNFADASRMSDFRGRLSALARELGLPLIDTIPFFEDKNVRTCILWAMNRHPNAHANQIFAEGIFRELRRLRLV